MKMSRMFMRNCRVVDGTGSQALENAMIVVDGPTGRIEYVGAENVRENAPDLPHSKPNAPQPGPDDEVMDLLGCTVLPGLFNIHTHLGLELPFMPYKVNPHTEGYWTLLSYRRALEAMNCGVTTMRCTGGPHNVDVAVRNAIDKGMLWGPRLKVAGSLMLAHGGHGHNSVGAIECSGVAQFREETRNQIKYGADFIKICLTGGLGTPGEGFADKQMTDDEVAAVVEVAHMAGKKVAAHTGGDKPIQDAVRLGVDCIEHGYTISDETAKMMADAGTWLVPTLAVTHAFSYLEAHGSPAYQVNKAREAAHFHTEGIARAIRRGVRIAVGTDLLPSDPLDGTTATTREVELLVETGMTPLQAIHAATLGSAALCEVDGVAGSIVAGKQADFVVVTGKPDLAVSDLRNTAMVMKAGFVVWSSLEGSRKDAFRIPPTGLEVGGGTFKRW